MRSNDQILSRMHSHGTLLCVGLDPDRRKLPPEILESSGDDEEKILEFLKGVVDAVAEHVCAFKAQKAFFDLLSGGHEVLREIVRHTHINHPGISIIADCKIGDIDNTMEAYAENLFSLIGADGVVVNPYMGDDVIAPLAKFADKSIVVLVKTSNIGGAIVQDVHLQDGRPFWKHILDLVVNRWNGNGNMIPVISSTTRLDLSRLRKLIPDSMPILLAGVGAQGGDYTSMSSLLNASGTGVFVNSSRGILYPSTNGSWKEAIRSAAITMKMSLNQARGGKSYE